MTSQSGAPGRCQRVTHSPEETFELGREIGQQIAPPVLFLLDGELGTGKTVFVRGLAAGLGIDPEEVTSPSFTLVNLYRGPTNLYHLDLYRIPEGEPIEEQLGLAEILAERAIVAIEWGDRLRPEWKRSAWRVDFHWLGDEERELTISHADDTRSSPWSYPS